MAQALDLGGKWIINMSLGGGKNTSTNTAVRNARLAGIIVAVAAGNSGQSACEFSPASAAEALTVGATTSSDQRSSFSNYGTCLDLFAPGSDVVSLGRTSNPNSPNPIPNSGTSMASPHVAGAAAIFYQLYGTADEAESALLAATVLDKISDVQPGSPNKLLQVPLTLGGATPAPSAPPTRSPTPAPTGPVPTAPPTPFVPISAGVPVAIPSLPGGTSQHFRLSDVKAGDSVECAISGNSGDADLYLALGKEAQVVTSGTHPNNVCVSSFSRSNEQCPKVGQSPIVAPQDTYLSVAINAYGSNEVRDLVVRCCTSKNIVRFQFTTDEYSEADNYYEIALEGTSIVVMSRALGYYVDRSEPYEDRECLPNGRYRLTVYDTYPSDGLLEGGSFQLIVGGVELFTNKALPNVWDVETYTFTIGPPSASTKAPTPAPTKAPTLAPTRAPTPAPTRAPTLPPTKSPTLAPTKSPTPAPTKAPSPAPTKFPTSNPTKLPTPVPTSLPACTSGDIRFEFSLRTDDYSFEDNGYKLVKQGNSQPLFEQPIGFQTTPARNVNYVEAKCLGPGTYTLTVEDKFEDGLCCRFGFGYYEVKFNGVKQNSYSSAVGTDSTQQLGFGKTATHQFTIGSGSAPVPTSAPTRAPTKAPTIPTPAPTSSPNCSTGSGGTLVEVVLKSDNYSQQDNHFTIVNANNPGGSPLLARQDGAYNGPAGSVYSDRTCLPAGRYVLTVFDDPYGDGLSDGLCCAWGEGYFQFYVNGVLQTDVPQSWAGPPNAIPSSSFDSITYEFTI
jgi:hypothetical protein